MSELVAYIKEHGDRLYLQAPVGLYAPEAADIEKMAFAEKQKLTAPNPNIMWLRGQYVEADNANENGDQWAAGDLAITHLTPMLMPVTVMHDFRTAVGTIADVGLKLPSKDDVVRARIDTVLALWAHRFPEIAHETKANAEQGTLMQSMECLSPNYDCSTCGLNFLRLPHGDERQNWCAHLKGEGVEADQRPAARILRNVVFTGTGLIFGTRGARGAYPEAHLEAEELAELHARAHGDTASKKPTRRKNFMEIEDRDYAELVAKAQKADTAEARVTELEADVSTKDTAVTEAEAAKVKAEGERDEEKKRADEADEKANRSTLRDERLAKFGAGFTARIDKAETTKKRLSTQAETLTDEEWESAVAELEEIFDVKRDATAEAGAEGSGGGGGNGSGGSEETAGLFERETVAASQVGGGHGQGGGDGQPPSPAARDAVIGGLVSTPQAASKDS